MAPSVNLIDLPSPRPSASASEGVLGSERVFSLSKRLTSTQERDGTSSVSLLIISWPAFNDSSDIDTLLPPAVWKPANELETFLGWLSADSVSHTFQMPFNVSDSSSDSAFDDCKLVFPSSKRFPPIISRAPLAQCAESPGTLETFLLAVRNPFLKEMDW